MINIRPVHSQFFFLSGWGVGGDVGPMDLGICVDDCSPVSFWVSLVKYSYSIRIKLLSHDELSHKRNPPLLG